MVRDAGHRMAFVGVKNDKDIADFWAYLCYPGRTAIRSKGRGRRHGLRRRLKSRNPNVSSPAINRLCDLSSFRLAEGLRVCTGEASVGGRSTRGTERGPMA